MRKKDAIYRATVLPAVLLIVLGATLASEPRFAQAQEGGTRVFLPVVSSSATSQALQSDKGGECPTSGTVDLPPLSSALHVLPPLGESTGAMSDFDRSLTDYLTVTVCAVVSGDGCTPVATFTSEKSGGGLDYIKLQYHHYHVNWKVANADIGKALEIRFAVAGLDVSLLSYTPKTNRTVPDKFQIDNHPQIRARVLHEQGYTATEVAQALVDEFDLEALETAWILAIQEGYSAVEVGQALKDIFALEASEAALILKDVGFSVDDVYTVLTVVYEIDDACELDAIFEGACFPLEKYLRYTKLCYAERFAPVLKFDGAYKGLPMSAQVYFENMMHLVVLPNGKVSWQADDHPSPGPGRVELCGCCSYYKDCRYGMSNTDFSALNNGDVPTYYKVIHNDEGRLRIAYWWFYGWQPPCYMACCFQDGAHHGDWEHILVTTSADRSRVDAVTYYFHGSWYTRQSFPQDHGRPVVLVGKLGHGSYHSRDCSNPQTVQACCEYADYRDWNDATTWDNTYENLVDLDGDSESWLLADRIGTLWHGRVIDHWRWGPPHAWCRILGFPCSDWEHTSACGTHPTVPRPNKSDNRLDWSIPGCGGDVGCGDYKAGCPYLCDYDHDEGWPW